MPDLGAIFQLGQTFPEEGVFFRVTNSGPPPLGIVPQGIAAIVGRFEWGDLNTPTALTSDAETASSFGSGTIGADLVHEAWAGQPLQVVVVRQGAGGTAASFSLKLVDGTTVAVTIPVKYAGLRGNGFMQTLQDSLIDATKRVWSLYEGATLLQSVTFAKAPTTGGGKGEPGALVAAINASNSPWVGTAVLVGTPADSSTLQTVATAAAPGTAGTSATVDGSALSNALATLTTVAFNTLAVDVEDTTSFAVIQAWADYQATQGQRFLAFVGEPTSVDRATRLTDAAALNDFRMVYVANGYVTSAGNRDGARAAARAAGAVAGLDLTESLTHQVVTGALSVLDPLVQITDYRTALGDGALAFRTNPAGQVWFGLDQNTYITSDANHHAGWGEIDVVRIYDGLQDQIYAAWAPLRVHNDPAGRIAAMNLASRIIANFIKQELLVSGSIIEDPDHLPELRNAWFVLTAQVDYQLAGLYVTMNLPMTS